MRLAQFTYLHAIVECGFNVSRAAAMLRTSQPGISKQIRTLEQELGFDILARKKNKLLGLTPGGEAVFAVAKRIASDTGLLKSIRGDVLSPSTGQLTVATTHIHARYTLLGVIKSFCRQHPEVSFTLRHSDPAEVAELVSNAKVDMGISVPPRVLPPNVVCIPLYKVNRVLITPKGHPLMRLKKLTLAAIADYPLVAYDQKFSSGWRVLEAFEKAGLRPRVVLTGIDAEVLKAYVAEGLGVALVQELAYNTKRDPDIAARNVDSLMDPPTAAIMLRRNGYLRNFAYRFIELITPSIDRAAIKAALDGH
jgi:LysR family cys regulon transcriptional activator